MFKRVLHIYLQTCIEAFLLLRESSFVIVWREIRAASKDSPEQDYISIAEGG